MSDILLIESGPVETRVALLEDGRLAEIHIERPGEQGVVGNIYKGRVSRVVPGIQAAFVDIGLERDAFLVGGERPRIAAEEQTREGAGGEPEPIPIERMVQEGDELTVQVLKEPTPDKGARVTRQVSLPGRYIVLLPGSTGVGISRRIEDQEERLRLSELVGALLPPEAGLIVRTAARGREADDITVEVGSLVERWKALSRMAATLRPPAVIHQESRLIERALRDLVDRKHDEIWVEAVAAEAEIRRYLKQCDPGMVARIHSHQGEPSLFDRFRVDDELARATRRRVWLRSGGHLVIDETEALIAIDVNSGRHTEAMELEETALETNLAAAAEVARQIRLRDLSGIIVIDFIDMQEAENRQRVVQALESALARDRNRCQLSEMSDFGLVAITRKRTREGLQRQLTDRCPCCDGDGRVSSAMSVGLELARELRRRFRPGRAVALTVAVHPRVRQALVEEHTDLWRHITEQVAGAIELEVDAGVGLQGYEIRESG